MARGGSTSCSVDLIVPGPAFQTKSEPGFSGPCSAIERTSVFQVGHFSRSVSSCQTDSGSAAICTCARATAGAFSWISIALLLSGRCLHAAVNGLPRVAVLLAS